MFTCMKRRSTKSASSSKLRRFGAVRHVISIGSPCLRAANARPCSVPVPGCDLALVLSVTFSALNDMIDISSTHTPITKDASGFTLNLLFDTAMHLSLATPRYSVKAMGQWYQTICGFLWFIELPHAVSYSLSYQCLCLCHCFVASSILLFHGRTLTIRWNEAMPPRNGFQQASMYTTCLPLGQKDFDETPTMCRHPYACNPKYMLLITLGGRCESGTRLSIPT